MATTKVIKDLTELNPGNPDYVLNATNAVTVTAASGSNKYYFDGVYDGKFGLRIGTTVLTGVPVDHPIAVLNNGLTGIAYTGTFFNTKDVDGVTYDFYTGDVTITVTADFGVASYYCYYHGYMGGENNFVSVYSEAGLRMPTGGAFSGTPDEGMMRNDTTQASEGSASTMQHYNGTDWKNFVNLSPNFSANTLVVGAGGGAASSAGNGGAGGGGVLEGAILLSTSTNYTLQVGAGGAGGGVTYGDKGSNGSDSIFDMSGAGGSTYTAVGGGAGGACNLCGSAAATGFGQNGGSGGGGGGTMANSSCNANNCVGGTTTQTSISPLTGYGNTGGSMQNSGGGNYIGAGGGGAGGVGTSTTSSVGGAGGVGHISTIITTAMATANSIGEVSGSVYFSGGGGGSSDNAAGGSGGLGGGGNASGPSCTAEPGTANTGGGGSGGDYGSSCVGREGGSGVLIIKYPDTRFLTISVSSGLNHIVDSTSIANFKVSMFILTGASNGTGTISFS